jgi:phosphatidylinositol 3-kinase
MVDGTGGSEIGEYRQGCSLACQAFNALRKSAGLILNLMSDAGIEDLSDNPTEMIAKVERFRLHLKDEQAGRYFFALMNDCLAAIAPRVMDVCHSIAVARR